MAGIRSIGWWVPKERRFAPDLSAEYSVPLQALENFGLRSRVEPGRDDHPSNMGARAVRHALTVAGLEIDQVDLLIFASMTRDYPMPWVGAFGVLYELAATRVAGFDISNRCAGIHDALWLAAKLIEAGTHKRVVVCCGDRFDHLYDDSQPSKTPADVAYSAGAAAAVIDNEADNEIVAYSSYPNPDLSVHIQNAPMIGGTRAQLDENSVSSGLHKRRNTINLTQTAGLVTYLRAADARNIPTVARAAGFEEIDFVVASPLDIRGQLSSLAEIGIPRQKTFFLLPRLGHLGPADSLINLGCSTGTIKIGRRVVMSTRTATFSNALAVRALGENLGIRVKGSNILQSEIDACVFQP